MGWIMTGMAEISKKSISWWISGSNSISWWIHDNKSANGGFMR